MVKSVAVPEWLKKLPLAPEFYPTETEFADPIAYISKIEKEVALFGICKIIPPIPKPSKKFVYENLNRSLLKRPELGSNASFRGASSDKSGDVEEVRAVFTTRQQEIGYCSKRNAPQPTPQKQVWQSGEVYSLEQFEAKAKAFSRDILGKVEDVNALVVETLFWKSAVEEPMYVEYANDVPGSAFSEPIGPVRRVCAHKARGSRICVRLHDEDKFSAGDGSKENLEVENVANNALIVLPDQGPEASRPKSLVKNHGIERTSGYKLSNSPWNLQVISRAAGSLTRFMLDDIPGVTSPMIYIGMLFSWFAWHVEDHELHSLNFLHTGSPKTWYAVPEDHAFAFEEMIHDEAYADNIDTLAALAILGEKTTIVSPEIVTRKGIPCCRLVQNPGEFVVTFPRAYHIGFSHGFNCGEAANFATPEWLGLAKEAAVRRTIMDHLPMLSHQQLLYHLTMSFASRVPISFLPGVRSSRLKNRQKEARELLVKRAFIEDLLESNKLMNELLQKDPSFRAVLWNSNSLPPFGRESMPQTENCADTFLSDNHKSALCLKDGNGQRSSYDQITLHTHIVDDLDIFDLTGDFEISSGTLPCVACGILGFPYSCVIQPSSEASREILSANSAQRKNEALQNRKSKPANVSKKSFSATTDRFNEKWNSSCGLLRPRIFCLEHAVQTVELLRPKGGANVLVICHSDFLKIKATASVIAEEMGHAFGYKEVVLDFASIQDLNLINLAVDDEPNTDWTSNLDINIKGFLKARKDSAAKPREHQLKLCGLLSNESHVSQISWNCRKLRRKRKPSCQKRVNSWCSIHEKKDELVKHKEALNSSDPVDTERDDAPMENPDVPMEDPDVPMENPDLPMDNPDVSLGNPDEGCKRRKVVCRQYSRKKYRSKPGELIKGKTAADCLIKLPQDTLNNTCIESEFSVPGSFRVPHEQSETTGDGVENCILTNHEVHKYPKHCVERTAGFVSSQIRDATRKDSKVGVEDTTSAATSSSKTQLDVQVNAQTSRISAISDAANSCISAFISLESSIDRGKETENGNNLRIEVRSVCRNDKEDTAKDYHITEGPNLKMACVAETNSDICPDKIDINFKESDREPLETTHEDDRRIAELPSHSALANSMPENMASAAATHVTVAPGIHKECHMGVEYAKAISRDRERGKGELMLLGSNLNPGGFVKSPCEGLRPRIRKEELNDHTGTNTAKVAKEPSSKKKKPSEIDEELKTSKKEHNDQRGTKTAKVAKEPSSKKKRSSEIDEGLEMTLDTYKCSIEQSFECTWNGCKMTFDSISARIEHLQTHMGTRPYQCESEGCGLAFRYPAEVNRHRRRTGHVIHGAAAV